ncbi:hypothetical protein HPP92_019250 [Vanilla planifolia]|uniref:Digalactosyldiacylglycerol synthase 2, chloroplastic n=1 Tax=Vanilla planifolia TaxID=51239 RepID=A0A835UMQ9_VANPL|nr:hypothetical protein HPP92_019250 [Vanilla planifolia]
MLEKQHIAIYTTASLPWMTGTAVNPLFRAAYLAKNGDKEVTLVIPWLSLNDQELVYPNNITFNSPSDQEKYIRQWLGERIDFTSRFKICFYPGKFSKEMRSILPVGDITECISDEEADVAVLEEPEHLTWYHHGRKWKSKFRRVVGVVHTNYLEYVKREKNSLVAYLLKYANCWVTYIYCDKNIRLSGATQLLPRSVVCNVHGVNPKFLEIGRETAGLQHDGNCVFSKGAYYIGKMVWSKGYRELLKLLHKHQKKLVGLQVDLYGTGEDSAEVTKAAEKLNLIVRVYPGRDHADPIFRNYKVFLNPSTTDVVCTTTAEALAMGKIVICADHPSNDFFKQFPNCRQFNNGDEFASLTLEALGDEPIPLTESWRHELSWEAATERFAMVAELNRSMSRRSSSMSSIPLLPTVIKARELKRRLEDASASLHQAVSGIEAARRAFGAVPRSLKPDEQQCRELGLVLLEQKKVK